MWTRASVTQMMIEMSSKEERTRVSSQPRKPCNACKHIEYTPICICIDAFRTVSLLFGIENKTVQRNVSSLAVCWFYLKFVTCRWNVTLDFCLLHIKALKVFFNFQFLFFYLFEFVFVASNVKSVRFRLFFL